MRILVISAFHPPYHSGGYELRVKNILDGLVERGHEIHLLTNKPERQAGKRVETSPYPVLRRLHNRYEAGFFPCEVLLDLQDTALLQKQINDFKPDLIYIGHLYILSKALLPLLARLNVPILYDEGGSGLIDAWTDHGRWYRFTGDWRSQFAPVNWIKSAVIRLVCSFSKGRITPQWEWPQKMKVVFNSQLNLNNAAAVGLPIENSRVLHSGVDTKLFTFMKRKKIRSPLRIIVPGRFERRKGQLDAVELIYALFKLGVDARLTLVGAGWNGKYANEVENKIKEYELQELVFLKPMLTHQELAEEYGLADICFFPSYQQIGFSRTPIEAMACGCFVISYGNEGSDEIIVNNMNGFLSPQGDFESLIQIILELINSSSRVIEISNEMEKDIKKFSFPEYIVRINKIIESF